jgi:chemotaxis response regulator CheB
VGIEWFSGWSISKNASLARSGTHAAAVDRNGMATMKKPSGRKMRKKGSVVPMSPELQLPRTQNVFPIVGIGASAGGLEALELFLKHVPDGCGMAFVIVQHLDPTHKGIMVELLQRTTRMPVVQAATASNGAWACTRSTRSPPMCTFCARTPRRSNCSPRSF